MNSPETMDKYLHETFNIDKLAEELGNRYRKFYFAYVESELAGYIKLNYAPGQSDINNPESVEVKNFKVHMLQWTGSPIQSELLFLCISDFLSAHCLFHPKM